MIHASCLSRSFPLLTTARFPFVPLLFFFVHDLKNRLPKDMYPSRPIRLMVSGPKDLRNGLGIHPLPYVDKSRTSTDRRWVSRCLLCSDWVRIVGIACVCPEEDYPSLFETFEIAVSGQQ